MTQRWELKKEEGYQKKEGLYQILEGAIKNRTFPVKNRTLLGFTGNLQLYKHPSLVEEVEQVEGVESSIISTST